MRQYKGVSQECNKKKEQKTKQNWVVFFSGNNLKRRVYLQDHFMRMWSVLNTQTDREGAVGGGG